MKARDTILVLFFSLFICGAASGQTQVAPVVPFDRYGRIKWDDEMERINAFAQRLKEQANMIGYIYIREAQISCVGYAVFHGIELTQTLIRKHHIAWNRVAWRDLGYGDSYEVTLWLFPAGEPPKYQPQYQSEATYIENCESLVERSRFEAKLRAKRRAAKKRSAR